MRNLLVSRVSLAALCVAASVSLVSCDSRTGVAGLAGTTSFDVSLNHLVLSAGTLAPAFDAATTSYTVNVANGTTSVTVTPTASSITEVIKVNGVVVNSGSASASIPLAVGTTRITVLVTAEDGRTTRMYALDVVRVA